MHNLLYMCIENSIDGTVHKSNVTKSPKLLNIKIPIIWFLIMLTTYNVTRSRFMNMLQTQHTNLIQIEPILLEHHYKNQHGKNIAAHLI
mgnify:CR=1 FL=1